MWLNTQSLLMCRIDETEADKTDRIQKWESYLQAGEAAAASASSVTSEGLTEQEGEKQQSESDNVEPTAS